MPRGSCPGLGLLEVDVEAVGVVRVESECDRLPDQDLALKKIQSNRFRVTEGWDRQLERMTVIGRRHEDGVRGSIKRSDATCLGLTLYSGESSLRSIKVAKAAPGTGSIEGPAAPSRP